MIAMRARVLVVPLALLVALAGSVIDSPQAFAAPWKAPAAQVFPFVDVSSPAQRSERPKVVRRAAPPTSRKWPAANTGRVEGLHAGEAAVKIGDSPVHVSVPTKAKRPAAALQVEVLGQQDSSKMVGPGVVVKVSGEAGTTATVDLDYSEFAGSGGGGYGARLHWVRIPDCSIATPDADGCREATSLASQNRTADESVSATVTLPEAQSVDATSTSMLMAAVAGTGGDQGTWSKTSLNASSLWSAAGSSGAFTWSYPLQTPPVAGSLEPSLALNYNSGSTDGVVSANNNQASWVGEGFDLSMGFIERSYVTCPADKPAAGTAPATSQDLCWYTDPKVTNDAAWDNATLSMSGHSGILVRVGNTASWRLKDDDGTRVEKLGAVANSASPNSEYWKVTTPDGTQFFFGKGKADGASAAATDSRWMVPVAANQSGEPGYKTSFASAFLSQAWRWNLDHVVDPSGDTMTVYYDKEANRYLQNGGTTQVSYDRGGTIGSIFYGERQGSEAGTPAAKVNFVVKERCDTSVSSTCLTDQPTATTVGAWPDVPTDAICESGGYCPDPKSAPSFFTRKRLAQVNTFTRNASDTGYDPVDSWDLGGTFPATNDATSMPTLWLNTITHTGKAGSSITLPSTTLEPTMMHNRITGPYGDYGLNRPRLSRIWSESGSRTSVTYSGEDCTPSTVPLNPATNTTRCFPSYYSPDAALTPYETWFTKYVVSQVEVYDQTVQTVALPGLSDVEVANAEVTSYTYADNAAWHWDDSVLTWDDYRTWNQWRGYNKVTTIEGSGSTKTSTESTYFRGMNGDRANAAGTSTKTVNTTDSAGGSTPDNDVLAGQVRETRALRSAGGSPDSRAIFDPWTQAVSGATDGRYQATMVDVAKTTSTQFLTSSSRSTITTVTARDQWGHRTAVEEEGDTSITGDEKCTRTSYATPSGGATAIDLVVEQTVMPNLCSTTPSQSAMISGARHFYDGSTTLGQVNGPGFATRTDQLVGSASHTWRTAATAAYDQHGRTTSVTDALSHTTTTNYSPATNRAVKTVTVTSADPDASGPAPAQVATTTYDPRFGLAIKTVAPAGQTSEQDLDALGRTTAEWQAGQPRSNPASVKYTYVVNQASTGVNAVKTEKLVKTNSGTGYRTSWQLLDSLMRVRQTQTESALSGSQVVDIRYDSRGNQTLTDDYLISSLPTSTLVTPSSRANIPRSTRSVYDFANRTTTSALYGGEVKKWQTANVYSGDRVATTPPAGGTPTTTVFDVHGRTTQLIQHLGATTSATPSTTSYAYTPAGQIDTMTDPKGNKWSQTYDLQGNRLNATDPDAGTSTTTYNEVNLPVTVTDARSKGVKYTYDNLNRVTKTTTLDGATTLTTASYDIVNNTNLPGLLASSSRWVNGAEIKAAVNSYDSAGRATSTSFTVPAITNLIPAGLAATYTVTNTYNADGSPATTGLPATGPISAETLTYGYSAKGMPNSQTGMAAVVKSTTYSQWDTISSIGMGSVSGNSISMMFNREESTLRLTRLRTVRQVGGTDEDTAYRYDNAGNVIGAKDTLISGVVDNQCFQYDYQRQLTQAFTAASTATCSDTTTPAMATTGPAPYWTSWATDTVGKTAQRISRSPAGTSTTSLTYPADGASSTRPHSVTQAVTTGSNATTSNYTYDAAGNTVTRPGAAGATQALSYNDEGKLSHVDANSTGIFDAIYDAAGNRIIRRENGKTTLTIAGTELSVDNTTGISTAARYYTHQGITVGVRTGNTSSTLWSIITDHQNTSHNQIRNSDSQLKTKWQDPYGAQRGVAPTGWAGEVGFVGGTQNGTGLITIGAREYDASLGRFTSVDSLLSVNQPVQWNPYSYGDNSGMTNADPSGMLTSSGCGNEAPINTMSVGAAGCGNPGTGTAKPVPDKPRRGGAPSKGGGGSKKPKPIKHSPLPSMPSEILPPYVAPTPPKAPTGFGNAGLAGMWFGGPIDLTPFIDPKVGKVACGTVSGGFGGYGSGSMCIGIVGGLPVVFSSETGGLGTPSLGISGNFGLTDAQSPSDLAFPPTSGTVGVSIGEGPSLGGDFASTPSRSDGTRIWVGTVGVGIGVRGPLPFEIHGGGNVGQIRKW